MKHEARGTLHGLMTTSTLQNFTSGEFCARITAPNGGTLGLLSFVFKAEALKKIGFRLEYEERDEIGWGLKGLMDRGHKEFAVVFNIDYLQARSSLYCSDK